MQNFIVFIRRNLLFRATCTIFVAICRKTCQDILVKRNSMLSESPPRNKQSYMNIIEGVPIAIGADFHI